MSAPKVIRLGTNARADVRGAVAAVGNMDGVHRGHQALIGAARDLAGETGAPLAAAVFEPHPRMLFQPDAPPFLLTTLETKVQILGELGVEIVYVLTFDRTMAGRSPEGFVGEVLKDALGLAGVVVGAEFQFGKGRAGNAEILARLCAEAGVAVRAIAPKGEDAAADRDGAGEKFSSSLARAALRAGDPQGAARVLGRAWRVSGPVREGDRRGRTIGFPTANMGLGGLIEPKYGVYAVRVTTPDGLVCSGVANFGLRPTIGGAAARLETYIFDYDGDLYGQDLHVDFVAFLRGEKRFDGLDALKAQIARDCEAARSVLAV